MRISAATGVSKRLMTKIVKEGQVAEQARTRIRSRRKKRTICHCNTDTDTEAESSDKRPNHRDMERLRRISHKILFDNLKKQIPATKDKKRAPKVVILREAAALCRKHKQEDIEREKLRKKRTQLQTKLKKLRSMLSGRYRATACAGGRVRPYR